MDITITGRNLDLDSALKAYIKKKLGNLEKLYKRIYQCEVVLEEEKLNKNTEIVLYLKRNKIVAKESSTDIYASVDIASDNVKKQLRRLHGKVQSKRRRSVLKRFMNPTSRGEGSENLDSFEDESGDIVKTNAFADKPMLPEEAKLELQIGEKDFIMFKNADTGENNVIFKRNDGHYGLIEPKF